MNRNRNGRKNKRFRYNKKKLVERYGEGGNIGKSKVSKINKYGKERMIMRNKEENYVKGGIGVRKEG
jgi:hypothetical protein